MLNIEIIYALERFAPPSLQESWDNTGLQVGTLGVECTGVLVCFDVTPEVVEEAIAQECNLIISHHPLFFKGVKRLTGSTPQEISAINAITAGISIYSSHTALDSTLQGVSYELARQIGVEPLRVLDPKSDRLVKLEVTVPESHAEILRMALFDAGAGAIGHYDCCSYNVKGTGTFRAQDGAQPYVGAIGEAHTEPEEQITVVLDRGLMNKVERALIEAHPYEVPAYQFVPMLNTLKDYGLGIYGTTDEGLSPEDFVERVKKALGAETVRTTKLDAHPDMKIRRVAVCGGAGGEFIGRALAMGAQAYVSADIRYHDFLDYGDKILLIDAGHFETEVAITNVVRDLIKEKCPGARVVCANCTNPVNYL